MTPLRPLLVPLLIWAGCSQPSVPVPIESGGSSTLPPTLDSATVALEAGELLRCDSLARTALAGMDESTPDKHRYTAQWQLGSSLHRRGFEDTAHHVLTQAYTLAEQHADSGAMTDLGQELAAVLIAQGNYPGAHGLLLDVLRYYEKQGDRMRTADILLSIAKVHYMQDDDSTARAGFEQAIHIYRAIGDSAGIAVGLNNLSNVMVEHHDYAEAIELLRYNFALRSRIMPKRSRAAMEATLSRAFLGLEQYDSAFVHARGCMAEALKHGQRDMQALAWVAEARALRLQQRYTEALCSADSSRAIATALGRPEQMSEAHKMLYLIHRDRGDHEHALMEAERHFTLDDSLVNAERNKMMVEMRTRYDVERVERENERLRSASLLADARTTSARMGMAATLAFTVLIIILAWALLQRSRNRAHLREMELEQQVLRSMMDPHFLFNALNTIPGLYATGDVATANDHVGHLSKYLRNVLETSRRRTVPLAREIELVEHYLRISANRNPGRFTWNIDVRPNVGTGLVTVPPMLVQPVVENALEHGMRGMDGFHLDVRVDMAGSVLTVEVEDNGIGRGAAGARPSQRKHGSMGIALVRQRIGLFDPLTPAHEAVVVFDKKGADGAPTGTKVVLRMHTQTLTKDAAAGDRG